MKRKVYIALDKTVAHETVSWRSVISQKNYRILGIVGDKLFLKAARTDSGAWFRLKYYHLRYFINIDHILMFIFSAKNRRNSKNVMPRRPTRPLRRPRTRPRPEALPMLTPEQPITSRIIPSANTESAKWFSHAKSWTSSFSMLKDWVPNSRTRCRCYKTRKLTEVEG